MSKRKQPSRLGKTSKGGDTLTVRLMILSHATNVRDSTSRGQPTSVCRVAARRSCSLACTKPVNLLVFLQVSAGYDRWMDVVTTAGC